MDISLDLSFKITPPEDDPASFLHEYTGQIIDLQSGQVAGSIHAFVLNAEGSVHFGHNPFDVLDSRAATAPYMELLSRTDAGNFTPSVLRALDTDFVANQNMLIINRLEVLPQCRGRALGLQAMHMLLVQLSMGCELAAIKPFPLQFEQRRKWNEEMLLGTFEGTKKGATLKLRDHYARLGFKPVGRSRLMICDVGDGYSMPRTGRLDSLDH